MWRLLFIVALLTGETVAQGIPPYIPVTGGKVAVSGGKIAVTSLFGARTDFTNEPWPVTPPDMGNQIGAGTCTANAAFGFQVCRLTDQSMTRPTVPFHNIFVAKSGSGDDNLFNPLSNRIIATDGGGAVYPMTFTDTGTNMSAARMYVAALPATNGFTFATYDAVAWGRSKASPYKAYALGGAASTTLYSFDFTSTVTPPSPVQEADFTSALNTAVSGTFGNASWDSNGSGNFDDSAFGYAFAQRAAQDNVGAFYVAVWKHGQGVRVLNIHTLTVTGEWGSTGAITGTACTVENIHNVKMVKGSNAILVATNPAGWTKNFAYLLGDKISPLANQYFEVTTAGTSAGAQPTWNTTLGATTTDGGVTWTARGDLTCTDHGSSPYVWFWDSLTYQPLCTADCSGHWTAGMTHWVNNALNNDPFMFAARTVGDAAGSTGITPARPNGFVGDWHGGWNTLDDNSLIFGTTANVHSPCTPPTIGWQQEVLGFYAHTGPMLRFAKTMAAGCNDNFNVQNAISSASQDGRYVMWSSDWLGTLGATSNNGLTGGATCDNASTPPCRGDIFVVRIH